VGLWPCSGCLGAEGAEGYCGRMKRPPYTDADYEIVTPAQSRRNEKWNGVGLPPEFAEAPLLNKIVYLVVVGGGMSAVAYGAHYLASHWLIVS
jgi:hypothetical protein